MLIGNAKICCFKSMEETYRLEKIHLKSISFLTYLFHRYILSKILWWGVNGRWVNNKKIKGQGRK